MNNSVNHALALRINELLKEKNITRYRLAMNSGVTHSTLKNIIRLVIPELNGKLIGSAQRVPVPTGSTTILIASGFDMSVSEFLDSPLFLEENLNI